MMRGELVRMEERFRLADAQVSELLEERTKMRVQLSDMNGKVEHYRADMRKQQYFNIKLSEENVQLKKFEHIRQPKPQEKVDEEKDDSSVENFTRRARSPDEEL